MNIKEKVEARWLGRAKAQNLKPRSMAYRRAELEFFTGAMAAIDACDESERPAERLSNKVPMAWVMDILRGEPIVKPEVKA